MSSRPLAASLMTLMLPSSSSGKPWQGWCSAKTWVPAGRCMTACGVVSAASRSAGRPARAVYSFASFSGLTVGPVVISVVVAFIGLIDRRPYWCVVGRPFQLARRAVDAGGAAFLGQRRRQQHVVDAQAEVLLEAEHPVIPPREGLFRLLEQPEAVGQAEADEALEGGAFGFRAEDAAGPGGRSMHVAVVGCGVVVAAQRQLRIVGQLFAEPDGQRVEPAQFVVVFVAAYRLTVGHVGADDAGVTDRAADQALLFVGEMRVAADDVMNRLAGEQGDAVVGLLAGEGDLVAGRLDFGARKIVVFELQFLQAQGIRLRRSEPVEQVRQAHLQRIDVPGSDLHLLRPPEGLAPNGAVFG